MENLLRPVDPEFRITSPFGHIDEGLRGGVPHKGVDFACPIGTHVKACFDGTIVILFGKDEGDEKQQRAGNRLALKNSDHIALYFHLDRFNSKVGQKVNAGDVIAFSGNTGYTTGPHLHFQLEDLKTRTPIDPGFLA